MTAHHPWSAWPLVAASGARSRVSVVAHAVPRRDPRLDITVTLRRCATYRKALRGAAAISYPAGVLWMDTVANWVTRHGVCVDVSSVEEMNLAVVKGISPQRLVMHRADASAGPIRVATNAGAGRFVVDSGQQVAVLSCSATGTQRLLVDVTAQSADVLAAEIMARPRLDLIGLHCRVGDRDREPTGEIVREMIAQMSWIRHQHAVILTRISLAGAADLCCDRGYLRDVSEELDEALDDACARFRYPRPALVLPISRSALNPTR
jgi:diaminopimelate decarboxylase